MDKETALILQEAIDRLQIVGSDIRSELSKIHSVSGNSLCKTCKKSNICSPHNNYKVEAITCAKYIKRMQPV